MNKKIEAIIILFFTWFISYIIAELFFSYFLDIYIVPYIGGRPLIGGINAGVFVILGYKLVDVKYNFEKNGGKLFRNYKLLDKK